MTSLPWRSRANSTHHRADLGVRDQYVRVTHRIDLSSIDADANAAGDQAFNFIGSDAFSGAAGELRAVFDAGSSIWTVSGDVDGDGLADLAIHVTTTGSDPIASGDFAL